MKYMIIAPVGKNIDALFPGLREFPTERVILLFQKGRDAELKRAKRGLEQLGIPYRIVNLDGINMWEANFKAIARIAGEAKNTKIMVNTATGDPMTTCAATSGAFVNGLKAFSVEGNDVMLLPVMKFSYYKIISERKFRILEILAKDKTCCASLEDLAKKTGMSLPLVSYHINGNLKSDGLEELGLVKRTPEKGRVRIGLTTLGRLLISGYVKPAKK